MNVDFDDNECTVSELVEYLNKVYGATLSGSKFIVPLIFEWMKSKQLPPSYGGNKILSQRKHKHVGYVLTIEGFSRELMEYAQAANMEPVNKKTKRKPKKRTRAYYLALKSKIRSIPEDNLLPDNWKEIGIKRNQFK
jgi:hypothetical protein